MAQPKPEDKVTVEQVLKLVEQIFDLVIESRRSSKSAIVRDTPEPMTYTSPGVQC